MGIMHAAAAGDLASLNATAIDLDNGQRDFGLGDLGRLCERTLQVRVGHLRHGLL